MFIPRGVYASVYENQLEELKGFINVVFQQVDSEKFVKVFQKAIEECGRGSEVYSYLLEHSPEAKGELLWKIGVLFKALKEEKSTLAEMVKSKSDPHEENDGYVEIGMPGRMVRSITPHMGLKGKKVVVHTKESCSDYLQSGFPRPYDQFLTLDYEPIPLEPESVSVVSCFIGLHHCPEEKLDSFIESISNVLKPGGIFLLREHDAETDEMRQLAAVIHSVFNAATGVTPEEERIEVRNFRGVGYWADLLERNEFKLVSEPIVRKGDTTRNTLLKFIKLGSDQDEINIARQKIISELASKYIRPKEQTHLTTVEWFNVESSQNLPNATNFWEYPYFGDTVELLKAFSSSWSTVRKIKSFMQLIRSDYTLMNGFIVTMMSVDYLVKGTLFTPLYLGSKLGSLTRKEEDEGWEGPGRVYTDWLKDYGERLEITPFYAQRYLPGIARFWSVYFRSWDEVRGRRGILDLATDRQTIKNFITGVTMTVDLTARAVLSTAVNWFFGGEEAADNRKIGLIIKTDKFFDHKSCANLFL